MRRWPISGLLLVNRLRRWPNRKPMLGQSLMFAGKENKELLQICLIHVHFIDLLINVVDVRFVKNML